MNFRSEDKAINVCYIIIRPVDTENASVKGRKGDLNIDGDVNIADAVIMQKYLLGGETINGEQAYASDVLSDAYLDVYDMIVSRKMIVE